jgi:hypothetical protein
VLDDAIAEMIIITPKKRSIPPTGCSSLLRHRVNTLTGRSNELTPGDGYHAAPRLPRQQDRPILAQWIPIAGMGTHIECVRISVFPLHDYCTVHHNR